MNTATTPELDEAARVSRVSTIALSIVVAGYVEQYPVDTIEILRALICGFTLDEISAALPDTWQTPLIVALRGRQRLRLLKGRHT